MRRFARSLVLASVAPAVVALPALSRPLPRPHPVRATVRELAVRGVDPAGVDGVPGWGTTAGPALGRPLALTRPVRRVRFSALGVTWAPGAGNLDVAVRVHQGGHWTGWHPLDADPDDGPDPATAVDGGPNVRAGTDPWFTGPADGYQVRAALLDGRAPAGLRVALVDPGRSAADTATGADPAYGSAAEASYGRPSIVTRAQWGADERLRTGHPSYAPQVLASVVHHTDSSNSYAPSQAAAMVRSVYAYHTRGRGWSDIGYNFLVDKYGRIYEGRYGGMDRPVIGAHAGGFNTGTVGVSLLGTYTSYAPTSAELGSLERLLAWKFGIHYVNPYGSTVLTSAGGTKYAKGVRVRVHNVSGHRDVGLTSCPGQQVYSRLPAIRAAVARLMRVSLFTPSVSTVAPLYLTTPSVVVRAGIPALQNWRLYVRDVKTGSTVRSFGGLVTSSITAAWDLRDGAGQPVPPGLYDLELRSWRWYDAAVPYRVRVEVRSPLPDGATVRLPDGTVAIVEAGRVQRAAPALLAALRPPAIPSYAGQLASLGVPAATVRDGMLVKSSTGAVYAVVDGTRRSVTASVASALGLPAAKAVPDAVLLLAPLGTAWTSTARHPDGEIVTSGGTAWRLESGRRRPFTSPAAQGFWTKGLAVAAATSADLARPTGAPLGPPEGVVLRTSDGGAGVVSGGAFRLLGNAAALGYPTAAAPVATSADLAALAAGDAVPATAHPSGALLKNGTSYVEVAGTGRRGVDPALVALDPRTPVAALPGEVAGLRSAWWAAPDGTAGRSADGTVRVVETGRLVALDSATAHDLGYDTGALPALEAADFGPLPVGPALVEPAAHPAGSLVTDGTTTWLVRGGTREPLAGSLVATWLGHPALPATATDLVLPAGPAALPATGAWVATPDGARWLVDGRYRHPVSGAVARRLGLDAVTTVAVVAADLTAATLPGSAVP